MLEPFVRENLTRLQYFYDRAPSPARHILTSARGWVLTRLRYSRETFAILDRLRSHESWNAEQIAEYQLQNLRQMLRHARRTVPFYARYPNLELRQFGEIASLPIIDRETLLANSDRLFSRAVASRQQIRAGTTGTTGANVRVVYTEDFVRQNWAFLLRQWAWAGIAPREPRLTLQGPRVVPTGCSQPPYWTYNAPERQALMSIFHLSAKTAPSYLAFLRRHRGEVLEGFPSVLAILADFALEAGTCIPMRIAFTSGEPLFPHVRAKIEAAFQTRVFDTYGMTEYCGLIQECESGEMHLASEYGFLEILDDNDNPAKQGEEGYFVWTGLLNAAMPLIRYRIGDRGHWLDGSVCACGRAFPRVVPTITRESDILRCPDGRIFSPRALNQLLKETSSFRCCQFIHQEPNRIVVRAVARAESNGQAAADLMNVRARLQRLLDGSMQATAEFADAPVVRKGGKIPLIVNQATSQ